MSLEYLVILDNKEAIRGTRATSKEFRNQPEHEIILAATKIIAID